MGKSKNKIKIKLVIDIFLIIAFFFNIFTALGLLFGFAGRGSHLRGGRETAITNIFDFGSRSSFRLIHDWSGILIIVLILAHLIINWETLVCYFKNAINIAKVAKTQ